MIAITKQKVEELLDAGELYVAISNGRWWQIRRNGATKKWKRDANRIYIPFKYGLKGCGHLTETDFLWRDGKGETLHSDLFRHVDDVPRDKRP